MIELIGKTAVVTGAASGIGLGLARACAARSMAVALSDTNEDALERAVAEIVDAGGRAIGVPCDVRSRSAVEELRDAALAAFGSVELVCNNAGLGFPKPMIDATPDDWDLVMNVNVRGVVNGVDAFLPLFVEQGSGHVSATASISGLIADPGLSLYNASKMAVVGMLEALALELKEQDHDVTVSVLCPGPVATDLAATSAAAAGEAVDEAVAGYLARGMAPDVVGELAVAQIAEGRFWLFSHPEMIFDLLDTRIAAMKNGGQLYEPADDWVDQ